jgi:hypothetical protein
MQDLITLIVNFLTTIGISVQETDVGDDSFLPGLRVVNGGLIFDRAKLVWPGDLLHEAGHIATIPSAERALLNDAMEALNAHAHGGEAEATAWAYAAIVHLQLDPAVLFHAGGYHGQSDSLISTFGYGVYPGAFGLSQMGMSLLSADAIAQSVAPYPHMTRWLRE